MSSYATFDNSPIAISDINGDEPDGIASDADGIGGDGDGGGDPCVAPTVQTTTNSHGTTTVAIIPGSTTSDPSPNPDAGESGDVLKDIFSNVKPLQDIFVYGKSKDKSNDNNNRDHWYTFLVNFYYRYIKTADDATQAGGNNNKGGPGKGSTGGRIKDPNNEDPQVDWAKTGVFEPEELGLKSTELASPNTVRPIIEIVTTMDDFLRRTVEIGKTVLENSNKNTTDAATPIQVPNNVPTTGQGADQTPIDTISAGGDDIIIDYPNSSAHLRNHDIAKKIGEKKGNKTQ
jgi:hypothetical protein